MAACAKSGPGALCVTIVFTIPSVPMVASSTTTPSVSRWLHGYTGLTSTIFVGGSMQPPDSDCAQRCFAGSYGGGGNGVRRRYGPRGGATALASPGTGNGVIS